MIGTPFSVAFSGTNILERGKTKGRVTWMLGPGHHWPSLLLTLCKFSATSCGLAEDGRATNALHHALGVREDGSDLQAAGTLHVHEVGVGVLDQSLQLVLALLLRGQRVQQILG